MDKHECLECAGTGYGPDRAYGPDVWQEKCERCGGAGVVSVPDEVAAAQGQEVPDGR